ncbi:MAG TPA: murein biosynthesis integral membrane protein MurJ [Actinomycetota bacterium]
MADTPVGPPPGAADADPPPPASGSSLTRATAVMSAGTAASRLTGFLRIAVIAWAIGGTESKLPDTYNLANSLPNIVYQLVLGEILATVFVPIFVEHITTKAREEATRLASTIFTMAVVVSGAFAAITVLGAPWLMKIYTFGIDDPVLRAQQEATGTFFLRLFMPQMIFYAATAVLTGLLNAHRRFAIPMFAPVFNNLIVAGTFALFRFRHGDGIPQLASLSDADVWLLGGGTTLGVIAMTIAHWPSVVRLRRGYRLGRIDWTHPAVRRVGGLAKYSFGYVIVNQAGLWVIFALANGAATAGGVTAYQNSWILYQLPYGLFAVSIMTYLVPRVAEQHVGGDRAAVRDSVSLGLRATAFIVLPAAAGFVALGRPIIRLLLEHGVFGAASTDLFADTFVLMVLGLGAYAAFQQLMRAFYAMQDTRTPLLVNVAAVGAEVGSAVPLFLVLDIPGLGLAHTVSYLTGATVGGLILRARLGGLDGGRLLRSHLRIGAAAALTGLVVRIAADGIGRAVDVATLGGQAIQVGGGVAVGLVTYALLSLAFRVEEAAPVLRLIRSRLGRTRGPAKT